MAAESSFVLAFRQRHLDAVGSGSYYENSSGIKSPLQAWQSVRPVDFGSRFTASTEPSHPFKYLVDQVGNLCEFCFGTNDIRLLFLLFSIKCSRLLLPTTARAASRSISCSSFAIWSSLEFSFRGCEILLICFVCLINTGTSFWRFLFVGALRRILFPAATGRLLCLWIWCS
jgi:hypothetical protein